MLLSGLALGLGCVTPRPAAEPATERDAPGPSPNQPLLLALQNAVAEGPAGTAEQLIERLSTSTLSNQEQELVEGYRRVLVGRALVQDLEVELFLRQEEGRRQLLMSLENQGEDVLTLSFPPVTLEFASLILNGNGEINRNMSARLLHPLEECVVTPGEPRELTLGDCPVVLPEGALAVRDAWRISIRAGQLSNATGSYPAERMPMPQLSVDTLAPALQGELQEPVEFAARMAEVLASGGQGGEALLACTARLDPARRAELLPLLAEVLEPYTNPLDDRNGKLAAAVVTPLRWISPGVHVDSSLAAWSKWTREWTQRTARMDRAKKRSGLVLP